MKFIQLNAGEDKIWINTDDIVWFRPNRSFGLSELDHYASDIQLTQGYFQVLETPDEIKHRLLMVSALDD